MFPPDCGVKCRQLSSLLEASGADEFPGREILLDVPAGEMPRRTIHYTIPLRRIRIGKSSPSGTVGSRRPSAQIRAALGPLRVRVIEAAAGGSTHSRRGPGGGILVEIPLSRE